MIVGDPSVFAIESGIAQAYERRSLMALGFFVIDVGGYAFGVRSPEATMLACSYDEVRARVGRRGHHTSVFATGVDASVVADAVYGAFYAPEQEDECFLGLSRVELTELVSAKHLLWAPDGDAAFDDGSYVIQFDIGENVRLIGFKSQDDFRHDPSTLRDVTLSAESFYGTLERWRTAFEREWEALPRT